MTIAPPAELPSQIARTVSEMFDRMNRGKVSTFSELSTQLAARLERVSLFYLCSALDMVSADPKGEGDLVTRNAGSVPETVVLTALKLAIPGAARRHVHRADPGTLSVLASYGSWPTVAWEDREQRLFDYARAAASAEALSGKTPPATPPGVPAHFGRTFWASAKNGFKR